MLVPMKVWPLVLKVSRIQHGSGERKFCRGRRVCAGREAVDGGGGKAGEAREAWCPRERTRIDWSRVEA